MKNELQIFKSTQFGEMRTLEEDGKILFCGSDAAKALGYVKPNNAINQHCKDATLKQGITDSLGRKQDILFIQEGDLYRLIVGSKLPAAEKFERWVFDEVLPTIRKNGYYAAKAKEDELKAKRVEIMQQNARSREAALWLKIGENVPMPEYKQICASYASKTLAGLAVLPLPVMDHQYYTAQEVGTRIGITGNMVGRIANAHGLKAPQGQANKYGRWFWDKAKHCSKEVPAWKYTDDGANAIEKFFKEEKSCFM
ncbi:hypothetical protein CE91St36_03020 [Christensenellaceae bacterium]|nr:hypothetical protein CE91St36_03020 [Christensenellaceae bacterium]BDF60153.1 hypothetical protein CE91St37_03030 [Christensenellaceae bacterium]